MDAARRLFSRVISLLLILGFFIGAKAGAPPSDDAEIKQIFDADQKDRETPLGKTLEWTAIGPRDAARRKRVRELIGAGRLKTGKDYERAAFVFQHGEGSDDILLAHVLAVTAIGKGDTESRWIAAATLDRFLQRLGQPQVFGTQFSFTTENGHQKWTMEPYNRSFIAPDLRDANCVPNQEHQVATLNALSKDAELPAPKKQPCVEVLEH